jgi:hypothetical protein
MRSYTRCYLLNKPGHKGTRMDTIEQLHTQQYQQQYKLIPEQNPHEANPLFQLLYETQACKTPT